MIAMALIWMCGVVFVLALGATMLLHGGWQAAVIALATLVGLALAAALAIIEAWEDRSSPR